MRRCVAVVATLHDRNPRSTHLEACPHGSVEIAIICLEVVMTTVCTLHTKLPRALVIADVCVTSVLYFHLYYKYLPFYNTTMNKVHITHAGVFVWACVCVLAAEIHRKPEVCVRLPCCSLSH
jgi:hypothetical protein